MRGRGRDGVHMHNRVRGTCGMVGERVVQRHQRTHEVVQVTGDVGSCRLNLSKMSSAHARFPAENKTHAQAWHHVMTILHQCLGNVHSRETLKDDTAVSHTFARTTLCHCSHALSVCDNATARHLMDDISEHVHEKNDAHTAIHGPRRALERLRAMIWRV